MSSPSLPLPAAAARGRNGSLDVLRLAAAFAIVWFHAGAPGHDWAYSGLALFFVLLVALPLPRRPDRPFAEVLRDRAARLLRPWAVWSAIYAGLKLMQVLLTGAPLAEEFRWWMLLTGPELHLWFLPFGFLCLLAAAPAERALRAAGPAAFPAALLLAAIPSAIALVLRTTTIPLAQWLSAVPPVLIGFALRFSAARPAALGLAALAATLAFATAALPGADLAPLLGILAALAGLALPLPASAWTERMAELSLPVYLMHPAFLSVLMAAGGAQHRAAAACLAALLCAGLGLALRPTPLWKRLF